MKNNDVDVILPEHLIQENVQLIDTLFSPSKTDIAILILGENYEEDSFGPIVRIYLMEQIKEEWCIQEELQAFQFHNYERAVNFVGDLPNLSALDLMLLMNGRQSKPLMFN